MFFLILHIFCGALDTPERSTALHILERETITDFVFVPIRLQEALVVAF